MKTKYLLLAFFVSWQLQIQSGGKIATQLREKRFETKAAAIEFMSHRPFDYVIYQCVDSLTGLSGHCSVHDMIMVERP